MRSMNQSRADVVLRLFEQVTSVVTTRTVTVISAAKTPGAMSPSHVILYLGLSKTFRGILYFFPGQNANPDDSKEKVPIFTIPHSTRMCASSFHAIQNE